MLATFNKIRCEKMKQDISVKSFVYTVVLWLKTQISRFNG